MKLSWQWLLVCCLLGIGVGCRSVRQVEIPSAMLGINPLLLEIVTVNFHDGQERKAALTRGEILTALGGEMPSNWERVTMSEETALSAWMPDHPREKERRWAAAWLAAATLSEGISSPEGNDYDVEQLLKEDFIKQNGEGDEAWVQSSNKARLRKPDLVALLKEAGFEVAQGDYAPLLFVRRADKRRL